MCLNEQNLREIEVNVGKVNKYETKVQIFTQ